jgi:hypothetical protein
MAALRAKSIIECDCGDLHKPLLLNEARFVCVGSAQGENDPDITLQVVDLDDPQTGDFRQKYTAISYTWGAEASQASLPVRCNSGGVHSVVVSQNVVTLIAQIQRLGIRDIWVDQPSINQASDHEKATQIALMKIIYERAWRVFIWLGDDEDDSELAMDTLKKFFTLWWQMNDHAYQPGTNHLTRHSLEILLDCSNPASTASWLAVHKLLHRRWWSRAWIVQEATVNRELTWIFCGSRNVGLMVLDGLRDVYFAMAMHGPVPGFEFLAEDIAFFDSLLNMNGFALARRRLPGGRPFLQLASSVRSSDATDSRDKLWCIHGFANDANTSVISPTAAWSLSVRQLYISFTVWFLSTHRDLEILGHCTTVAENTLSLPSWIPNWSVRASCVCLSPRADPDVRASAPTYLASGHYKLPIPSDEVSSLSLSALRLQGVKVAVVDESLTISRFMTTADYTSGKAWKDNDTTNILSLTGCSLDELLARTLVADCRRVYYNGRWDSERIAADETLSSIQHNAFNPYQWRRTVSGRVLFRTRDMSTTDSTDVLLSLGPETMRGGDEVWLLKGGNGLYILRPLLVDPSKNLQILDYSGASNTTSATQNQYTMEAGGKMYELVGEAFVHGVMDGELLGMMGEHPRRARPTPLKDMGRRFCNVLLI